MTDCLSLYRQWQREAAEHLRQHPTDRGARLGLSDSVQAECLLLSQMIERGETTYKALIEEARDAG